MRFTRGFFIPQLEYLDPWIEHERKNNTLGNKIPRKLASRYFILKLHICLKKEELVLLKFLICLG